MSIGLAIAVVVINLIIDLIAVVAIIGLHYESNKTEAVQKTETPPWKSQEPIIGIIMDKKE